MLKDIREAPPPTETILVVDDEAYILQLVGAIFSLEGYEILMAKDGEEALRICKSHPGVIHLLLSDIVMPGMNGRVLWERFSRKRSDSKVLFISGYSNDVLSKEGHEAGKYPFLAKPFTPLKLKAKVREVLGLP